MAPATGGSATGSGGASALASGGSGVDGSGGAIPAGTGGAVIDSGPSPEGVNDLAVAPNPNSVLSCIVTWTTEVASDSTVQFGVGGLEWEIVDPEVTTDHRVVVIGMHAESTYLIRALSNVGGEVIGADGEFTTGQLPDQVPVGIVDIHDPTRAQPGWTLVNSQKGNGIANARSDIPPAAVMYDESGQPVWYHISGDLPDIGGAVSTEMTDRGVIIGPTWNAQLITAVMPKEVDFEGNVLWECSESYCGGKSFSHHVHRRPNGNYMMLEDVGSPLKSPVVHEVTPNNEPVWTLDWTDLVPPPASAMGDWCHGNSIITDLEDDALWVNCRWVGLMKVTYSTKTMQWLMPYSYGSLGLGDITYVPASSQPSDTHDPEVHIDDSTVLLYDNGGFGQGAMGGSTTQFRSRVAEYTIDETAKTATLTWEYPGSFQVPNAWYTDNWYSPYWGDADRLENGNVLVTAGVRSPSVEGRVFEVTKETGEVVWEFRFPPDFGVYRADRVTPPLVQRISQ